MTMRKSANLDYHRSVDAEAKQIRSRAFKQARMNYPCRLKLNVES
jgi:hypothetical protein